MKEAEVVSECSSSEGSVFLTVNHGRVIYVSPNPIGRWFVHARDLGFQDLAAVLRCIAAVMTIYMVLGCLSSTSDSSLTRFTARRNRRMF